MASLEGWRFCHHLRRARSRLEGSPLAGLPVLAICAGCWAAAPAGCSWGPLMRGMGPGTIGVGATVGSCGVLSLG